jgi:hypothetical protein
MHRPVIAKNAGTQTLGDDRNESRVPSIPLPTLALRLERTDRDRPKSSST